MISEELKQAAQEYTEKGSRCQDEMDAFIAGAEWMARRFSKLYAEKFLSMQVQEPIPEPLQKVIDDHFWEML